MEDLGSLFSKFGGLKEKLEAAHKELAQLRVEGAAGGGAVRVVANGLGEISEVILDPRMIDLDDLGELQSLILAAVNGALAEARESAGMILNKATGGMAGILSDFLGGTNLI